MDTLLPIEDRGGPAQPLLLATGLQKHFPVGGGLLGRNRKVVRAVDGLTDRKSTRLNSSHSQQSRMPSSA